MSKLPSLPRGASYRLPKLLHAHAARLDPRLGTLRGIRIHVSPLPRAFGADAIASDGQVWVAPDRFDPRSEAGLQLIGHELAHLGQQLGMAPAGGVLHVAALERAADAFGAHFAAGAALDASWIAGPAAAARPAGTIQCSGSLASQVVNDEFGDDEEEDEEDEPMFYPGGARDQFASSFTRPRSAGGAPPPVTGAQGVAFGAGRTVQTVGNLGRSVGGVGVGAFNQVQQIAAGTGMIGSVTGAAGSAVGAALLPAAAVTGPVGLALMALDIALSAKAAHSTYSHMQVLENIIKTHMGKKGVRDGTMAAIGYTLNKKNKKLKRKGLGCVPVLGSFCNTVYTLGRTIQKRMDGSRGVERRKWAVVLWENMMAGDPAAIAACQELLGTKIFTSIRTYHEGHLVLKKKMKSL